MTLLKQYSRLLLSSLLSALNNHHQLQKHQRDIVQTLIKNPPGHQNYGQPN